MRHSLIVKTSPILLASLISSLSLASVSVVASQVTDYRFDTAGNMLAYTELELSGEPLAETLGLDLDVLDPNEQNKPTEFDYIAGIESYEFSEEGMYELNYRSGLGLDYLKGLRHKYRGSNQSSLQNYMAELAQAVELPIDQLPKNINLISLPYRSGSAEFSQAVDTSSITEEIVQWYGEGDSLIEKSSLVPAYTQDYKTLAWSKTESDAVIEPAGIGALLLKEVMWSQDFLGGMHTAAEDEEVEATNYKMDRNKEYALGVSAVDGMNGLLLTELSLEKLQYLQEVLGYNGKALGQAISPNYDPEVSAIWFPHEIKATTRVQAGKSSVEQFTVQDGSSQLRDNWLLLWPLSEYFAFTDQRLENKGQNPAFAAVFDGAPFASAAAKNIDAKANNDVVAKDAFSMASNLSNAVFKNLASLHFNKKQGTFFDRYVADKNSKQTSIKVTTYDAAYSLVALSIYQRAQDALPVGYASASSANSRLHTSQGKLALSLIKQQADFIINSLQDKKGLVADSVEILTKTNSLKLNQSFSIDTQFASIRGLVAAFLATQDERYREQARKIYQAVDQHYYDAKLGTWAVSGNAEYTPWSVAAISSAMREAMLHLKNNSSETTTELTLQHLVNRYTQWFRLVVTGQNGKPGLQLAEPIGDTGEHILVLENGKLAVDSDLDGIKQINHAGGQYGRASVLAGKLVLQ